MGDKMKYKDFLAVRGDRIETRPYAKRSSKSRTAAILDFQLSHDLIVEAPQRFDQILPAFALAGGVYIILTVVVGFIFSCFVPYFMYLNLIRNLFKIDNNEKAYQNEEKIENKKPEHFIKEAKAAHKKRVRLTTNACDSCMLMFEGVIRMFTCGLNKWSRIMNAGRKEIDGELEIYHYM